MLPGTRLLRLAHALFDEQTVAHVFEPLVADWQREWEEASRDTIAHRVWVLSEGVAAFVRTMTICGARDLLTLPEGPAAARFAIAFMTAIAIGTVVLVAPWAYFSNRLAPDFPVSPAGLGLIVVYFAPTVIALAMLVAIASVWRGVSRRRGRFALQATAVCAVGTFLVSGWLGPFTSRELMRRSVEAHERYLDEAAEEGRLTLHHTLRPFQPLSGAERIERRLASALTRPDMLALPSLFEASSASGRGYTVELHRRLQAPILVVALGVVGWVLASTMTASTARIVMWWMLASLMAYAAARLPADLRFSVLGVWLPVGVFAAAAIVLAAASRAVRRSRAAPQVG